MSSLLPEVLLGVDEVLVHNKVDVGVVRVEELLDLLWRFAPQIPLQTENQPLFYF